MVFPEKSLAEYIQLGDHARKANYTAIVLEDEAWAIRQLLISLAIKYGARSTSEQLIAAASTSATPSRSQRESAGAD